MSASVLFSMMRYRGGAGVARAVLERGAVDFITMEPSTSIFEEMGLPRQSFTEYLPKNVEQTMEPGALKRLRELVGGIQSAKFREAYGHFDDATWERLQEAMYGVLRREFYSCMVNIEALLRCAAETDLRLLVCSEDVLPTSRSLVLKASRIGIPSLHVIHSVPCGAATSHPAVPSTHLAVYSEHTKRLYESLGVESDRIFVTGNPAWDRLAGPPRPALRRRICHELGLDPAKPVITYALTNSGHWSAAMARYPEVHIRMTEAVIEAFTVLSRKHPDWQFGLRPRPWPDTSCPIEAMVDEAREAGLARAFVDRLDPYASVALADVSLSTESNMGIEAMLLGKPVINVVVSAFGGDVYQEGFGPLYDEEDAVLPVKGVGELAPAIESAVLDDATRTRLRRARVHSIERFNGSNDGKAAQRVADLIISLMERDGRRLEHPRHPYVTARSERRERAGEYNARGEACFEAGDFDGAVAAFSEAIGEWTENALFFNNLGTALHALGSYELAWDSFVEALHVDPYLDSARQNLMAVGAVLQREDEARALLALFGVLGRDG